MNSLRAAILRAKPESTALADEAGSLSYGRLADWIYALAEFLQCRGCRVVGVLAENSIAWVVTDLACLEAGLCLVSLPRSFSVSQLRQAVVEAGIDTLLTDRPEIAPLLARQSPPVCSLAPAGRRMMLVPLAVPGPGFEPTAGARVSYRVGGDGRPEGLMLSPAALEQVTGMLTTVTAVQPDDRHVALRPLTTLPEAVAGIYTVLSAGASAHLPKLAFRDGGVPTEIAAGWALALLKEHGATRTLLAPAMLRGLLHVVRLGAELPSGLRFVGLEGAVTAPQLIAQARQAGLPVHDICATMRRGTGIAFERFEGRWTGRPLSHLQPGLAAEGAATGQRDPWTDCRGS